MYMLQTSPSLGESITPMLVEGGLTAIGVAVAFAWPRLGFAGFSQIERGFGRLARKQELAVAVVGLTMVLLRLVILPLLPRPLPVIADDFSFLLSGDTFAHGRLANPTPAMWVHFEAIFVDMKPTYMSMYFPGQGLVLATGKVLFGHPWYGLLIASGLMCSALCWMLQAWLPPCWALLGGFLSVLRLGIFSYWTNSYTGGGSIAALGGALVLGGLPRFMRTARPRYALLMAVGIGLLAITRPYECVLLCIPVAVAMLHWLLTAKGRPTAAVLFRRTVPALALLVAVAAWLGYYDYRAFGNPLTLPYTVNRATYAMAPYYFWQSPRPEPVYHHEVMLHYYRDVELAEFNSFRKPSGFLLQTLIKPVRAELFFAGFALFPPLVFLPWTLRDRRIRFLVVCLLVLVAGMLIEIYLIPHYLAPFAGALYAVGLQAMRHLWHWSPGGQRVGTTIVRLSVTICLVMAGLRLFDRALHFPISEAPPSAWMDRWYGPDHFGTERANIESRLEQLPGQQLVLVRASADPYLTQEWIFNAADIDDSKVIWAHEMDGASNRELVQYYKNRKVWLVQPDLSPAEAVHYPVPEQVTPVTR
jgi:hypothetical protein